MKKAQRSIRPLHRGAALVLALLPLAAAAIVAAQAPPAPLPSPAPPAASAPGAGPEVTLELRPGQEAQLKLAMPAFKVRGALSANAQKAAAALEQTVRADLQHTGIFVIQGPAELAAAQLTGDPAHDFEQYRALGNEVLLLGEVYEEGGRLALEGRVTDLKSGQSILGKRYRGGFELARRMAHSFADEVVLYFTGRRGIALTSLAFYSDRTGFKEIYLMDYDGFDQRAITGHKSISMSPDWSPTGDAIAYVSFFDGKPGIYMVDLNSGLKKPMVTDGAFNASPGFSPDGKRIAFARSLAGNTEIFVANRDGTDAKRLTYSPGIDTDPAWSPTGAQIAFTSSRSGSPNVYVMDAEGTNLRRVSFGGSYNDGAAWSPDGKQLAYASRLRGHDFDIVVTDLALLDNRVVTSGPGSNESPTWSPDGRFLAYAGALGGHTQIRLVPVTGGPSELLTAEGNNWSPDWSANPPQ
ncbi:MAG TPA: Tol-Pal system beta propeller repeat protein TolB [Thermoanaerobaculia bacterium]|nr:Tol-Pal system beta propeller repeat protein TolB [Thermoanaerobaculia bacterium]